jgi:hypothetical protein
LANLSSGLLRCFVHHADGVHGCYYPTDLA